MVNSFKYSVGEKKIVNLDLHTCIKTSRKFMKTSRVLIEKVYNFTTSKWGKQELEKRKKISSKGGKKTDEDRKHRKSRKQKIKR